MSTFHLTNIAPQVGKGFNRDAWNKLEMYARRLTQDYSDVYVCSGAQAGGGAGGLGVGLVTLCAPCQPSRWSSIHRPALFAL